MFNGNTLSTSVNAGLPCENRPNVSNKIARIKRPMNAFMVWGTEQRKHLREQNPTMHNSEISKQLGAEWRAMSTEEKAPYFVIAKKLSDTHKLKHPDYKYQPMKMKKHKAMLPEGIKKDHRANTPCSASRIKRPASFSGSFPQYTKGPAYIQTTPPSTTTNPPAVISSQLPDSEYYFNSSAVQFPGLELFPGQKNWSTYSTYFGGPADVSMVPSTYINPQPPLQPLSNAQQYGDFYNGDFYNNNFYYRCNDYYFR